MSGFAEKILDSFMDRKKSDSDQNNNNDTYYQQQQQQQQPYQSQPQQPPYPWTTRWDDREQRYIYINEQTGERSYTFPSASQGGYGGGGESYGYANQPPQQQGYYNSTGGSAPEQREEKSSGYGSAAAWGAGGLALGLGAGALAMHEGEEMSEFLLSFPFAFGFFSHVYPVSPHLPRLTITSNSQTEKEQAH